MSLLKHIPIFTPFCCNLTIFFSHCPNRGDILANIHIYLVLYKFKFLSKQKNNTNSIIKQLIPKEFLFYCTTFFGETFINHLCADCTWQVTDNSVIHHFFVYTTCDLSLNWLFFCKQHSLNWLKIYSIMQYCGTGHILDRIWAFKKSIPTRQCLKNYII